MYDWMINRFAASFAEVNIICQEEILEFKYDEESKYNFDSGGYQKLAK